MSALAFFDHLWQDYLRLCPQAAGIHTLFRHDNAVITNDHVALRTFRHHPISRQALEPLLLDLGYLRFEPYRFPDKHVEAWSYIHRQPEVPRVFFSELDINALSLANARRLRRLLDHLPESITHEHSVFWAGRLWPMPSWEDYRALQAESSYAAWLSAVGLHANHFTMAVHSLERPHTMEEVVARVQAAGFTFNDDGGLIKGSPSQLLEQASTLANRQHFTFAEGDEHEIPTCYYEFARRHPDARGLLYEGFVNESARHLFTSTDAREDETQ